MCELLWGKKTNQSSIQNAHNKRVIEEDGWYCFRNAVAMMLLIFCLHPSISFAANPAKISALKSDNITFNIPQQRADTALTQFAEQASLTLVFPFERVKEKTANRLVGDYPITQAAQLLLENTGLTPTFSNQLVLNIEIEAKGKRNMKTQINQRKHLLATFIAVFGAGAVSSGVMAQDGNEAAKDQRQLDEIIVTAQKREQNLKDVPISIAVMGDEELRIRGIENMDDLALSVPGLSIVSGGASLRSVFLRGISNVTGSSSAVGMYIDEVSVTGGSPSNQIDVRVYDLDQVEVLRGPQGTLYGQGSMGGTIRFVTKDPQLDFVGGRADISSSITKGGEASYKTQGVFNLPLIEEKLGLRVAGTYHRAGGWIDQPAANEADVNNEEVVNIRTKLLWQPTDDLRVKAMAIVHRNNGSSNSGEDESGNTIQAFNQAPLPSTDDDYDIYNLTITYDLSFAQLVSSSSYFDASKNRNSYGYLSPSGLPPAPPRQFEFFDSYVDHSSKSQELRLVGRNSDAWLWSVGAYYESAESPRNSNIRFGTSPGTDDFIVIADIFREPAYKQWSVFGDVSYALTDRFEVGAGIRYFEDDRSFDDSVQVQKATFDSVNPRVYASYKLTGEVTVYGSIAEGFRSGGFNTAGRDPFEPEEVLSYELGSKMSMLDGALDAEFALYYSKYSEYQALGTLPPPLPPLSLTSNSGDAVVKGVDVKLAWGFSENLSIGVNANYNDGEIVSVDVLNPVLAVGDSLPYVSKYQYSLWAEQQINLMDKSGFVRLDYSKRDSAEARNRRIGDHVTSFSDVIEMLNLNIKFDISDNISLGFFAENILNERGFIDPVGGFNDETAGQRSRSRPRSFGVDLGFEF